MKQNIIIQNAEISWIQWEASSSLLIEFIPVSFMDEFDEKRVTLIECNEGRATNILCAQ